MTFANLAAIQAAPSLKRIWVKSTIDSEGAGEGYGPLWTLASPTTTPGQAYTNDTQGIGTFPDTSSVEKWIVQATAQATGQTAPGELWICDRLVGVGGLDLTSASVQNVNSTALTRYTTGTDVQVYLEASVAVGSTNVPVISLSSYTDQDGNTGQVGGQLAWSAFVATDIGTVFGPMPLASGDSGVRSVEQITVHTASAGTTARFNLYLMKPLLVLGVTDSDIQVSELNAPFPHMGIMQRIYDGASLVGLLGGYAGAEPTMGSLTVALKI